MPAHELSARLSTAAVVIRGVAQVLEMFGKGGDGLRLAVAAIGEDGRLMEFTAGTMAGGFTTLAAQHVDGTRKNRRTLEENLKELREQLLRLEKLCAKGTEVMVHDKSQRKKERMSVYQYYNKSTDLQEVF